MLELHIYLSPFNKGLTCGNRKDKPLGNTFGAGFLWSEAIDAAADVYNGVGRIYESPSLIWCIDANEFPVRLLVNPNISWDGRVV